MAASKVRIVLHLSSEYQEKLLKLSLQRSVELARRVSMGFIVEELLDLLEQTDNPRKRSAELFGSTD
jgi:hypothetical protein